MGQASTSSRPRNQTGGFGRECSLRPHHVVVPDYEIAPGYQAYAVQTRDGRTLVGRLESETPNSVTIRDGSSQQHVILRTEVSSISASTYSLMPNELERTMSEQDLADLIGYLKADPRP